MKAKRLGYLLLVVAMGFAAVVVLLGLVGTSSAFAREQAGTLPAQQQAPAEPRYDFDITLISSDTEAYSLDGVFLGLVAHGGRVSCNGDFNGAKCNQKIALGFTAAFTDPDPPCSQDPNCFNYDFKLTNLGTLDKEDRRAVIEGTGTVSSGGKKEKISVTAIFQDNRDGTVEVTYVASNPEASLVVPRSPGTFAIRSKR